jgi:hypothetical protein
MKNILAENMLRFGSKNLDTNAVRKLQRLTEQGVEISPSKLASIAPGVDVWLTNFLTGTKQFTPNTVYTEVVGNYVVTYTVASDTGNAFTGATPGTSGSGTLRVYTLDATYGWPLLRPILTLLNSKGTKWQSETLPNLYRFTTGIPNFKEIPGQYIAEKFNTYWTKPSTYSMAGGDPSIDLMEFKNNCVALVGTKQAEFKQKFAENNKYAVPGKGDSFYKDQTAHYGIYKRSSYYQWVDSKITDPIARKIYELILDPETITKLSTPIK